MPILSKNPRDIHPAYKEAVVDSLLNGLSARLAGRGDFYKVVYGAKPSAALMSEFIMPMPLEERGGDEEADPIRISAHGMDFQIRSAALGTTLGVSLTGAVYVRILPTEDEVKPGGRLEATFPLTREARADIRSKVKDALSKLVAALPGGKMHPDWAAKSYDARKAAYESMGLPFDNRLDRAPAEEDAGAEGTHGENGEGGEEGEARPVQEVAVGLSTPDHLADDIAPPPKWLRLELALPSFEFTPATAQADAKKATDDLNAAIAKHLADWAASSEPETGGKLWGYRRARVRPSDVRNWKGFLERVRASSLAVIVPQIELRWVVQAIPDPVDATRTTVHVALENWTTPLTKSNFKELEPSLFQVSVTTAVPAADHQFLRLDRVKPSYRYNQYLKYPALGFNGGITLTVDGALHRLTTTWAPRYVLPRIIPTDGAVERNIEKLSQPDCLADLKPLVTAYEAWLTMVEKHPVDQGLGGPNTVEQLAAEKEKLHLDLAAWRRELGAIRCGLDILEKSRASWSGPGVQKSPLGIPFEAWVSMNTAMAKVAKSKGYDEWRLFQLAFILASIPAFATRIPEFHSYYTPEVAKHANAVTLLYFSTGGGKSEAFLGLLAFVLFIDRLRGKRRGVSALMRYPLRLLTLQQARRTFATMGAAEDVRHTRGHPGEPFSLGFWVGGSNTPNWHSEDGYTEVPGDDEVAPSAEAKQKDVQPYKSARERWLKLSSCPFCGNRDGSLLALRRQSGTGANAMGHYCTAPKEKCSWNGRFAKSTPLPFYIVDEDIYDLAPSVLLGTVDKLAAIGQSQGTIRKFFGMFGFAPLVETGSERLYVPMKSKDWDGHPGAGTRALFPSFASGEKRFFDPLPALLIQDEAHLLDESLGTFSGLFESALEAALDQLSPLLKGHLSYEPESTVRRKIKVIAASATVSEPQRQMRNLYQRDNTVQFPHPGPTLYDSFYATPLQPDSTSDDIERAAIPAGDVELRSHWARVYASVLTNGHRHTVAMASVLGHYHVMLTGLYERLRSEDPTKEEPARNELIRWVSPGPLQAQFIRLLAGADAATLLTLVDLHRIALTYVTNKKGGDQVIDTEKVQFDKLHHVEGHANQALSSKLISGAVSAADIQDIVRRAETRVGVNKPFPELNDTLRSVIATSAISHGVDVEEFNAMFFAGIPSDIAEYIQASSRVGRTHVGFSLLVPVPQRYRDRFVLEIHDIFHRFLERMILPAAVDRWAEKALVRVMPSFFQEYVCGMNAIERLCAADDNKKRNSPTFAMAPDVRDFLAVPAHMKATEAFMEKALGLSFSPSPEGKNYYRSLLKSQLTHYQQDLGVDRLVNSTRLVQFFAARNNLLRPMTSLRDVDQPGLIHESGVDASYKRVADGMTARAMTFIRRGSGADIDSTDSATEARS
ncbi:helicase-related protein [Pseudorhodoferax sp.]|uniref:helicase-related protein n=1 Tax=Pseudorhodoferax sp. TaxID=1993553 RepID=UPI0039E58C4E